MRKWILALIALVALTGCRLSETRTARRAADRLTELSRTIEKGEQMIEAALVSLNALREFPDEDQTSMFNTYRNELARLEDLARKTGRRREAVVEEKDRYLEQWGESLASIRDESLREISSVRRAEVEEAFGRARATYEKARASFIPLFEQLQDLRTLLGNDLSPAGIRALDGTIRKADRDGERSRKDLAAVRAELDELAEAIAPAPDEDR